MESRLAADLVDVRVHDDARAAALARGIDARAFTVACCSSPSSP
ncbi:eCIS core domain-containing protein [Nannocystis pusilla]